MVTKIIVDMFMPLNLTVTNFNVLSTVAEPLPDDNDKKSSTS